MSLVEEMAWVAAGLACVASYHLDVFLAVLAMRFAVYPILMAKVLKRGDRP